MDAAIYLYDNSFEGFLSVIFEAFRTKTEPEDIIPLRSLRQLSLGNCIAVERDDEKAKRVWSGLQGRVSSKSARLIRIAFLAQEPSTGMLLWRCLKKVFSTHQDDMLRNMLDEDVYSLAQMARRVKLEVHRFHGFLRFQETADGLWFAAIDPDHDIVRLLVKHFRARFANQPWVIYDTRRKYGVYYDMNTVADVTIDNPGFDLKTGCLRKQVQAAAQDRCSLLWKTYYDAINIAERKNHRQMKRMMPQRYWKYLPEKG